MSRADGNDRPVSPDSDTDSGETGGSGALDPAVIAGLRQLEDDRMSEIVDAFSDRTIAVLERLHEEIQRGDTALVARTCHDLKGASASLGASVLAQLCERLERAAVDEELTGAADLVRRVEVEAGRACAALKAVFPTSAPRSSPL